MAENPEVVIEEDVLFRAIRYYRSTSSSSVGQSQNGKICTVQHDDSPHENTSHFVPKIISIGPLHHGKPELQPMEDLKHEYLNDLLNRRGEGPSKAEPSSDGKNDDFLRKLLRAARETEERARSCYELSNVISSDDFVNMMVIDGCFLIEFFLQGRHYIPEFGWQLPMIKRDIFLFENQIPFCVLEEFFEVLVKFGDYSFTMVELAYSYLCQEDYILANYDDLESKPEIFNLLHLYHTMLFHEKPPPPFSNQRRIIRKWTMALFSWLFEIVTYPMYFIHKIFFADIMYPRNLTSAMELEEAGVRLQRSPMALSFEQGTLRIPVMALNDQNLCLLKNLLVFELYFRELVAPYLHEYASFLSKLIKNPGDLKVMEKHHIIITSGGGDESFELLSDLVEEGFENHLTAKHEDLKQLGWQSLHILHYSLNNYCNTNRHRWRAKLMKDYFGNPWSILGVLVGAVLLVLTTLQTVFTVLSYYHQQIGG